MVNTGKPSSGCKLCRARRIKCDEAKPACMKCLRSKRQCPGYRDPFEGKIRDETQSTIRKFKRTRIVIEKAQVLQEEALRIKNTNNGDGDDGDDENNKTDAESWGESSHDDEDGRDSSNSSRRRRRGSMTPPSASSTSSFDSTINGDFLTSLVTPLEQQAACYLLANYVLVSDSPGGRKGYYKFAYKIMTRPRPSKCLLSAFKAVSFVALASRPGASYLAIEAESHYSKALREVNKAIQDPEQVKRDDTLGAVLLLAFYETLATTRERLDEYISHVKGAAHLVKMRGASLVDTDEGVEMFSMTRNQFLAIRNLSPVFDHGDDDYAWLLTQNCTDAHVSRVATLTIRCSEIRMQVDRALTTGGGSGGSSGSTTTTQPLRDPRRIQAVLDLLRQAQALSRKLVALDPPSNAVWRVSKAAAPEARPGRQRQQQQQRDEADLALGDRYEFHNLYACMIYCIVWTSHLFLITCIFRCMAWLVAPDEWRLGGEYEAAVEVTRRRIADICAALPYACSWNGHNTGYSDFVCGATNPSSPSKGVAGMCIYRPAFTAMMSDYATPEQKAYLEGRLRFLADKVGIKQAGVLLKMKGEAAHPSRNIERDTRRA